MRKIKFRAWDRKLKAMFPIHRMDFGKIDDQLSFVHGVDIHDKNSDSLGDVSYGGSVCKMTGNPLQPRFELMQYTGLSDKNGKEIYEGDIDGCDPNEPMYVAFEKGSYGLKFKDKPDYFDSCINWDCTLIIGNIHQNPQLLK